MTYSSEVLADTPLGYWKLDDPAPVTAVLADASGNGHAGTFAGTATSVAGLVAGDTDKAISFSSGRGIAAYATWMQVATWSMVATIKPTGVSGSQTVIARYDGASIAGSAWTLRLDGNKLALYPFVGSGFTTLTSATTFVAGTTYDVAATYDGTTACLYVNGTLEASGARSGLNGTSTVPLTIGATSGGGETFAGVIDDVSYYGSALSGTTVAALASARTSSGYSAAVLGQGPLAYYRLNDVSSVGGTTPATLADSSGNSRAGSYLGGPTFGATSLLGDGSGTAVTFSGTNYADVPYASWMLQANFSVDLVFKPTSVSGTQTLVARHETAAGSTWILRQDGASLVFYMLVGGSFVTVTAVGSLVAGVRHHVACTYDGSVARIYVDGVLSNSATVGGPINATNTGRIRIAGSAAGPGGALAEPFTGTLDEVAFYGTVLSATRVAVHNAAAVSSYASAVLADAPAGYWRLGEASSAGGALDSSGNGRNGTYTNAPTLGQPGLPPGDANTSAKFNGTSNAIDTPIIPRASSGFITVEALVKLNAADKVQHIYSRANENLKVFKLLVSATNRAEFHIWTGSAWVIATGSRTLTTGTVYHLAGRLDGANVNVYVNGAVDGTSAYAGTLSTQAPGGLIGAGYNAGFFGYFDGWIDEAADYPAALSGSRLLTHAIQAGVATSTYSSEVLADAPAGYWRLGDASGATTAADASGNGRTGTYSGTPIRGATGLLAGDTDTAVTFQGSGNNQYVNVPSAAWMQVTTVTVEFLFSTSVPGNSQTLMSRDLTGSNGPWRLDLSGSKLQWYAWAPGFVQVSGTTTIVANKTYHVAATYDGTTSRLYLNGVLEASTTGGTGLTTTQNQPLMIGAYGSGSNFNGTIDEAAFYTTALSATRVAAHYNAAMGGAYAAAVLADAPWGFWNPPATALGIANSGSSSTLFTAPNAVTVRPALVDAAGGSAVAGNGSTAIASMVGVPAALTGTSVTAECWVLLPAGNLQGTLVKIGSGAADGWGFGIGNTTWDDAGRTLIVLAEQVAWVPTTYTFPAGAGVYHVAVVRTGGTFIAYVNGVAVWSPATAVAPKSATGEVSFGGRVLGTAARALPSTVDFDNPAVFASVLSPTRIAAHYNSGAGSATEVLADSPVVFLRDFSQAILADFSPNARPMVIGGDVNPTASTAASPAGAGAAFPTGAISHLHTPATLAQPTVMTYEFWMKYATPPSAITQLIEVSGAAGSGTGATSGVVLLTDGSIRLNAYNGSSTPPAIDLPSTAVLAANQWNHVVCSIGAAGQKIRVNKVTIASNATRTAVTSYVTGQVYVRGDPAYGATGTGGVEIGPASFWTSQLSDTRTDAHYDAAPTGASTLSGAVPSPTAALTGTVTAPAPAAVSGTLAGAAPSPTATAAGATTYAGQVLSDHPLGYWRLGDKASYAADVGTGALQTTSSGVTYQAAGPLPSSLGAVLDGTIGRFTTNVNIAHSKFSIEAWIKTTDANGVIASNRDAGGDSLTLLVGSAPVGGAAGKLSLGFDGPSLWIGVTSANTYNDGNWHHVVGVWDGTAGTGVAASQLSLYVDGVAVSTTATGVAGSRTAPLTGTTGYAWGKDGAGIGAGYLAGTLSRVALYGSALSATRIAAHYAATSTAAYRAAVVTDTPLAEWDLEYATGNTAYADSSGQSHPMSPAGGTAPSATGLLAGDTDGAADFNGTTHYGQAGYATWLDTSDVTVEAIINADSVTADHAILARHNAAAAKWDFCVADGKLRFRTATSGFASVLSATTILVGTTYHVAAVYNGTTGVATVYVNGVADGTATLTAGANGATSGVGLYLGALGHPTLYFDGRLDEVAFYGSILTSTRIAAHSSAVGITSALTGTLSGAAPSPTGSLAGTATPPVFTGTVTAAVSSPTAVLAGTVTAPSGVTGTLTAAVSSPTGALVGTRALPTSTGVLAGAVASPTASVTGTVTAPNVAPTANFTWTPGSVPGEVVFDGLSSSDPDGSIVNFAWDFGNGQSVSGVPSDWSGATVEYGSTPGSYQVHLTVTDNKGATGTVTKTVTIAAPSVTGTLTGAAPSPTATLTGPTAATGVLAGVVPRATGTIAGVVSARPARPDDWPGTSVQLDSDYTFDSEDTDSTGASLEGGEPVPAGYGRTFWWYLTPADSATMSFDLLDSAPVDFTPVVDPDTDEESEPPAVDVKVAVYTGTSVDNMQLVAAGGQSGVEVALAAGVTYYAQASLRTGAADVMYQLSVGAPIDTDRYVMDLEVLSPVLRAAPTSVTVAVAGGPPNDEVTFEIDGVVTDSATLDEDGSLEANSVNVPDGYGAGDHVVSVHSGSSSLAGEGAFTLQRGPYQSQQTVGGDRPPVDIPTANTSTGVRRWIFQDLMAGGEGSYVLPRNPSEMSSPQYQRQLSQAHSTAVDGGQYHLNSIARTTVEWTFNGYLESQAEVERFQAYYGLKRRFYVIDHRSRAWIVTFLSLELTPRKRQREDDGDWNDWAHDYKVTALIYDQDWSEPT